MKLLSRRVRSPLLSTLLFMVFVPAACAEEVLGISFPGSGPFDSHSECNAATTGHFAFQGVGRVTVRAEWVSPFHMFSEQRAGTYSSALSFSCKGACKDYDGYAPSQIGNLVEVVREERKVIGEPDGWEKIYERTDPRPAEISVWIGSVCKPDSGGKVFRAPEEFHVWVEVTEGLTLTTTPNPEIEASDGSQTGQTEMVAEVANGGSVISAPVAATTFTLDRPLWLSRVTTYHWNNGRGAAPGKIALLSADSKQWGPWAAKGKPGSGVQNVNWEAEPEVLLPAGTYTVIDSDPDTWSQNSESGGAGFVWVEGIWR